MATRWLYAREAAVLAGIPYGRWVSYDRPSCRATARVPLPKAGRRCPRGRKQWTTSAVRAWAVAYRRAGPVPQLAAAQALHKRIDALWEYPQSVVAEQLGISTRTVWRHRTYRCACT